MQFHILHDDQTVPQQMRRGLALSAVRDDTTVTTYTPPQYTRDDVEFETWYTPWMKQLAKLNTVEELKQKLYGANVDVKRNGLAHLRAIDKTASMSGNSAARAHGRNLVAASGDYAIALRGAIEIHDLFPEYGKLGIEIIKNSSILNE